MKLVSHRKNGGNNKSCRGWEGRAMRGRPLPGDAAAGVRGTGRAPMRKAAATLLPPDSGSCGRTSDPFAGQARCWFGGTRREEWQSPWPRAITLAANGRDATIKTAFNLPPFP